MHKTAFAIALVVISINATAQVPGAAQQQQQRQTGAAKPALEESKTKLEQFQAKTGSVIIMGFSQVGSVSGGMGSISVETREFTDAATGAKQFGAYIAVSESGQYKKDAASFIDLEEIDSLVKGIEYIAGLTTAVTKLGSFQAEYRTVGDLMVSTYSDSKGEVQAAVKSGRYGQATAYIKRNDLARFRELLLSAQAKLSALKTPQ